MRQEVGRGKKVETSRGIYVPQQYGLKKTARSLSP